MLRRAALCLFVFLTLVFAPTAAADGVGPSVQQGGTGVVSLDGKTRYVAVTANNGLDTVLESVSTKDGTVENWTNIIGSYGIPSISFSAGGGDSLSHDGHLIVLSGASGSAPSDFLFFDTRNFAMKEWVTLPGHFTFDALSPDVKRMYLIQYTQAKYGDYAHYVVRAYDLRTKRLLPGRIADRTQKSWVMDGFPLTRVTSADGRWVYTLYQNGGNGYPFIHALDTVRGVAHCIGLPMGNSGAVYNLVLSLHGGTLAVHWRSGRPFVNIDRTTWRVSPAPAATFPWLWAGVGAGAALLALGGAGALLLRRRRRAQELTQELDELLGLPEREVMV